MMIPWWIWVVFAGVIGFAELHLPGSYFIWIALGAALTALVDVIWELSLPAQLIAFAAASAVSCGIGYFVYRSANLKSQDVSPLNQRGLDLVGARGVVSVPLVNGQGKVRLGDSVWLAEGPDLSEGAAVVVASVRGTCVIVRAA